MVGADHHGVSISDKAEQNRVFGSLFQSVSGPDGTDVGFALDDADFFMSGAGRQYGSDGLASIVKLGREAGISQILIAQGSANVTKDLISNSNLVLFFRTTEPNLLDYASQYMRDVPEVEYVLRNLPRYWCLAYMPNSERKFAGLGHVTEGHIEWEEILQDTETEPSDEPPTADGSADTPDATGSSETSSEAATVPTTTPSTSETSTVSGRPGGAPAKPPEKDASTVPKDAET